MDVKFNINNKVQVKLTMIGIKHWIKHNNEIFVSFPSMSKFLLTEEIIMEKQLANGYWEFQLHELMEIFSSCFSNITNLPPFETEIIIPVELDRKNKIEKFLKENE